MGLLILNASHGCSTLGLGETYINGVYGANFGDFEWVLSGPTSGTGPIDLNALPLTIPTPTDGDHELFVRRVGTTEVSATYEYTIECTPVGGGSTCDLLMSPLAFTPNDPDVQVEISWTTTAVPSNAQVEVLDEAGVVLQTEPGAGSGLTIQLGSGLQRSIRLTDANGCQVTRAFTTPVYGCLDEQADNYNPLATAQGVVCTYSDKVELVEALPDLAPNGVPLVVKLQSQEIAGATPVPADCFLDVDALGFAAVSITVNGHTVRSGDVTEPGRFSDAATLSEALNAIPALAGAYLIRQSQDAEVRLTARAEGSAYNLTASTSDATKVGITIVPAVNRYHSQKRDRWGCWLQVWAVTGQSFGGAVNTFGAVLAGSLELPYRADNVYEFDIARYLQAFTAHAYPEEDGTLPDRLVAYFVRYGESYALSPTTARAIRTRYTSLPAWALEAVEVLAGSDEVTFFLPSARPQPWQLGADADTAWLPVLIGDGALGVELTLSEYDYARTLTTTAEAVAVTPGVVQRVPVPIAADTLSASVALVVNTVPIADPIAFVRARAGAPALTFVNRQGATETVWFEGEPEEGYRRSAGTFRNQSGTQLLSAEVSEPVRLYTKLLDRATWAWLRRELGTGPAAWLEPTAEEADAGALPVPVRVTDLDPVGNRLTGEYSLSVEIEPTAPVEGLTH